jgi:hypothetical protein
MKYAIITALICGYLVGWATDSKIAQDTPKLLAGYFCENFPHRNITFSIDYDQTHHCWMRENEAPIATTEYLLRDGKPTFQSSGHGFVLRPGYTDAKVQVAALQIACHAIRGCK